MINDDKAFSKLIVGILGAVIAFVGVGMLMSDPKPPLYMGEILCGAGLIIILIALFMNGGSNGGTSDTQQDR